MLSWADPDHMRPATVPAYCHIGAGMATANSGRTYYVLQAAYISEDACGPYTYSGGSGLTVPPVSGTEPADGVLATEIDGRESP